MFKHFITELKIEGFRCIKNATMKPINGVNLLYGGNDSGTTTVLEAIALLALQDSFIQLVDSDFFKKEVGKGFEIGAIIACEPIQDDSTRGKSERQSCDTGSNRVSKSNSASVENAEKHFKLTVYGTDEKELEYKVSKVVGMCQSEVEVVLNSLTETRIIGHERSGDHLFQKTDLKNTVFLELDTTQTQQDGVYVVKQMGYIPIVNQPVRVIDLNNSLRAINLPSISETSEKKVVDGLNLAGLKLSGGPSELELPLPNFGAGTQGITSQLYSESSQGPNLIQLVDSIEGGLDTTKQFNYLEHINQSNSQVFSSVHNSKLIDLDRPPTVWVNSPVGNIFQPSEYWPKRFQQEHPDIFLYKLIIIAEGKTEVGFITTILTLALGRHPNSFGIIVVEGYGNQNTKNALDECLAVGLKVGAMVDLESEKDRETWKELKQEMLDLLCQWLSGTMEVNVIRAIMRALPVDRLHEFISHPDPKKTKARLDSIAKRLKLTLNLKATPKEAVNQIWRKILKRKDIQKHVGLECEKAAKILLGKEIVDAASGRVPEGAEKNQIKKFESSSSNCAQSQTYGLQIPNMWTLFLGVKF